MNFSKYLNIVSALFVLIAALLDLKILFIIFAGEKVNGNHYIFEPGAVRDDDRGEKNTKLCKSALGFFKLA